MLDEIISVNSQKLYLGKDFTKVKNIIRCENSITNDMGSFISIEFENYNFVLNQIFNLEIYIKDRDALLETRIENLEGNIQKILKGFSFNKKLII